jgi:replicative DNA helicase
MSANGLLAPSREGISDMSLDLLPIAANQTLSAAFGQDLIFEVHAKSKRGWADAAGLKEIAKELECAVMALSQLGRAVDSRPRGREVWAEMQAKVHANG